MARILSQLTVLNLLLLLTTFGAGLVSFLQGGMRDAGTSVYPLHLYLGLCSVFSALAVHCLIFIYFLGTGRWVKEVALAYRLPDQPLPRLTRDLKRRAFPPALFAMLVPIAAAAAGAGQGQGMWPWWVHAALAAATLLVNAWAFAVEYRCVRTNAGVIDEVMHEVDRIRAEHGLPSNAEALREGGQGV
jgi:hypothetical protein